MKNPYAVLGIPVGSSVGEAKNAYRKLASKLHPDRNPGDRSAEERLKEVNLAYEQIQSGKAPGLSSPSPDWESFFKQAGRESRSGLDEGMFSVFDNLFRRQARPVTLEVEVPLSFEESLTGVTKHFDTSWRSACMNCMGKPASQRGKCSVCHGEGFVNTTEAASVAFEPGTAHGSVRKGYTNTGRPLEVTALVAESPSWKRDGLNLSMSVPVPLQDMVDGRAIRVITPYAKLDFVPPAGSLLGQFVRLRGQGVRSAQGTGDLIIQVLVEIPKEGQTPHSDRYAQQVATWQKLA